MQAADGATPGWQGETPADGMAAAVPKKPRSRWDETPANLGPSATPSAGAMGVTPGFFTGATPAGGGFAGMETPSTAQRVAVQGQQVAMTPEQYQDMRLQKEMWERNRPLTDEELDAMLPTEKEGYKVGGVKGQDR